MKLLSKTTLMNYPQAERICKNNCFPSAEIVPYSTQVWYSPHEV